jgi:hypothetical protein
MKSAFLVIPDALFFVIPAQAGIQTGCFTAKTQRRKGVAPSKAPAAISQTLVISAAGAPTQKPSLRLCVFAVNPMVPP